MPLSDEQKDMIVKALKALKRKTGIMATEFSDAKSDAISGYKAKPFKEDRKKAYEAAWADMPENYKKKVGTRDYFKKWAKHYARKMFGVTLSDTEVESILREAGI